MLVPGKLAVEQSHIEGRHLFGAALSVQPLCVTLLRHSITDKRQPRRTQRDQLNAHPRVSRWRSYRRKRFEIIESAGSAPSPGPQRAPVIWFTRLAAID